MHVLSLPRAHQSSAALEACVPKPSQRQTRIINPKGTILGGGGGSPYVYNMEKSIPKFYIGVSTFGEAAT